MSQRQMEEEILWNLVGYMILGNDWNRDSNESDESADALQSAAVTPVKPEFRDDGDVDLCQGMERNKNQRFCEKDEVERMYEKIMVSSVGEKLIPYFSFGALSSELHPLKDVPKIRVSVCDSTNSRCFNNMVKDIVLENLQNFNTSWKNIVVSGLQIDFVDEKRLFQHSLKVDT